MSEGETVVCVPALRFIQWPFRWVPTYRMESSQSCQKPQCSYGPCHLREHVFFFFFSTLKLENVSCRVNCWQKGICALTHHTSTLERTALRCQKLRVLKRGFKGTTSATPPIPQPFPHLPRISKPASLGVHPFHDSSSSSVICDCWRTLLPGA